jgi:Flp pilus assembly pilin Flp
VVIVTLNVAMGVYATIMGVVEANQKRATAGQWALNASMLANPVLLIVVGIIALIAALVIAYKKSETFRNIVNAAFAGVKAGISAAITAVVAVLRVAFKIMATLFRFTPLGFLITHFKEFARVAQVVADAVVGVFRWMFDQVKAIFDRIGDLVNKVKGWASFLPGVGRSAASGVSSAFAVPSVGVGARTAFAGDTGSLGATTINVRAIDPEGTAREVQGILDRHSTRQGRAPGAPRRRAW